MKNIKKTEETGTEGTVNFVTYDASIISL